MKTKNTWAATATVSLCLIFTATAKAGPNDYIKTPTVEYGEWEAGFKSGTQRNADGTTETANAVGFGFAPTTWWATEFYAKYAKPAGETNHFDAWEWESRFQLTETGKYPVDFGFLFELERPKDRAEGYELTFGPMFQKDWNRWQGNANLFLKKHVRAEERFDTELHYQLQLKYRHAAELEWGAQAFGNVGQWDHWLPGSQQELKVGPALFGKIKTSAHNAIKWNAALLGGATDQSPRTTLRMQAEYEF